MSARPLSLLLKLRALDGAPADTGFENGIVGIGGIAPSSLSSDIPATSGFDWYPRESSRPNEFLRFGMALLRRSCRTGDGGGDGSGYSERGGPAASMLANGDERFRWFSGTVQLGFFAGWGRRGGAAVFSAVLPAEAPQAKSRPFVTTEGEEFEGVVAAVDASEANSSEDADEEEEIGLDAAGRDAIDDEPGSP